VCALCQQTSWPGATRSNGQVQPSPRSATQARDRTPVGEQSSGHRNAGDRPRDRLGRPALAG
jgi:hypothetical protein